MMDTEDVTREPPEWRACRSRDPIAAGIVAKLYGDDEPDDTVDDYAAMRNDLAAWHDARTDAEELVALRIVAHTAQAMLDIYDARGGPF